jgi:glutathione S-transferase
MAVELYHFWSSVCSVRARMALEEKGVKWTSRYIDLFRFDQMKPEYLAINPDGVVPTLVHDGQPVCESMVIIDYVDDAFPGPALKPKEPLQVARMREFMRFCEDVFPAIVLPTLGACPSNHWSSGGESDSLRNHEQGFSRLEDR